MTNLMKENFETYLGNLTAEQKVVFRLLARDLSDKNYTVNYYNVSDYLDEESDDGTIFVEIRFRKQLVGSYAKENQIVIDYLKENFGLEKEES